MARFFSRLIERLSGSKPSAQTCAVQVKPCATSGASPIPLDLSVTSFTDLPPFGDEGGTCNPADRSRSVYHKGVSFEGCFKLTAAAKRDREDKPHRRRWRFLGRTEPGVVFIGPMYSESEPERSFVAIRRSDGRETEDVDLPHSVWQFKADEYSGKFVVASKDCVLYLYSVTDGCLGTWDVTAYTRDRYRIRCIGLSPRGQYVLFSCGDTAYLADSGFRVLQSWRTPSLDGWERRKSQADASRREAYRNSLSLLGLSGAPSAEEVKRAFRAMVFKHHPDRNPGDAGATERMKQIVRAYEDLTGEDAREAFRGIENAEYYYKVLERTRIQVTDAPFSVTVEFGIGGSDLGADWISATCLAGSPETVHLGCYSGRVYCLQKDGRVARAYVADGPVQDIRQKGDHLYVQTGGCLYLLRGDQCLRHIVTGQSSAVMWLDQGFMIVGDKELRLFTDEAGETGRLTFKNTIHEAYFAQSELHVLTAATVYSFSTS